jgi:hypothetical protein
MDCVATSSEPVAGTLDVPLAPAPRVPRLTVGALLRHYDHPPLPTPATLAQACHLRRKIDSLIELAACRTRDLGGQKWRCPKCAKTHYQFHTCRNRNCPDCGESQREKWLVRMLERALPIEYAHVVLTVPHELNDLIENNARVLYGLLMTSSWQAIDVHARTEHATKLGGVLALHTWGQLMLPHFHVHAIITLEGLSLDNSRWHGDIPCDELLGKDSLADRYRDRFLEGIKKLYAAGLLTLRMPEHVSTKPACPPSEEVLAARFHKLIERVGRRRWVVNVQQPPEECTGPEDAIRYLARYVKGVAISSKRLVSDEKGHVTFRYKDYRDDSVWKTMRIRGEEFVRRLALHILPTRFVRVRHCGLFANSHAAKNLDIARMFLRAPRLDLDEPPADKGPLA